MTTSVNPSSLLVDLKNADWQVQYIDKDANIQARNCCFGIGYLLRKIVKYTGFQCLRSAINSFSLVNLAETAEKVRRLALAEIAKPEQVNTVMAAVQNFNALLSSKYNPKRSDDKKIPEINIDDLFREAATPRPAGTQSPEAQHALDSAHVITDDRQGSSAPLARSDDDEEEPVVVVHPTKPSQPATPLIPAQFFHQPDGSDNESVDSAGGTRRRRRQYDQAPTPSRHPMTTRHSTPKK